LVGRFHAVTARSHAAGDRFHAVVGRGRSFVARTTLFAAYDSARAQEMLAFSRAELLVLSDTMAYLEARGVQTSMREIVGCDTFRNHCFVLQAGPRALPPSESP
jgi:hypothetical protein